MMWGCTKDNNTTFEEVDYIDTSSELISTSNKDTLLREVARKDVKIVEYTVASFSELMKPVFRIPSAIVTNRRAILVAFENREFFYDKGEIDILVARKEYGDTIFNIRKVVAYSKSTYGRTMNPIFVVDREGCHGKRGRIFLFCSHLKGEGYAITNTPEEVDMFYKYSDDDGKSWSPEYSLRDKWRKEIYDFAISSAANGIQCEDGTFIVPSMIVKDGEWHSGILYKRPKEDWIFSSATPNSGDNECTVYIDNDDKIVLDCRTEEKIRRRYVYNIEKDSFSQLPDCPSVLTDLKAEIHKVKDNNMNRYLLTYVDPTSTDKRENITLYSSNDAIIWNKVYRLQDGELPWSAYSNVYEWEGNRVAVYETNDAIKIQEISHISIH